MPRVLNKRSLTDMPPNSVYVGRPSKWGNRFTFQHERQREEIITKYRAWLMKNAKLLADLHELRGKDLVCWCSPRPCHADVLLELANAPRI